MKDVVFLPYPVSYKIRKIFEKLPKKFVCETAKLTEKVKYDKMISHFLLKTHQNIEQIKSKQHRKILMKDTGRNARNKEN